MGGLRMLLVRGGFTGLGALDVNGIKGAIYGE